MILYISPKDAPGYGPGNDVWDVLHDLFGLDNPPVGHLKPPCCECDMPAIDEAALDEFTTSLQRVLRG